MATAPSARVPRSDASLAADLVAGAEELLGNRGVIKEPEQLRTYECDGLTGHRVRPTVVALPETTKQVSECVALCNRLDVPFVARGAGTGLSGGSVPVADGMVISLARMNRILEIDLASARAVVQPGVANLDISKAVRADGFLYAPDPSSQQVCTIGGNVAENSGGAHCLKHGFTVNHVTGLELVLPDATVVRLGGKSAEQPGYDLLGAFIGSEGTLGIATAVTVRLIKAPARVETLLVAFDSVAAAGAAVSGVVAAGILAGAMEIMDRLTIQAAEEAVSAGYPDAQAILIVELDGTDEQVSDDSVEVQRLCRDAGATTIGVATTDDDRARFWKGRKAAFAAVGRISPDYYVQDGVVPRTRLPEVLERIEALSNQYGLQVGNVFHAGDGNLHPLVLYDARRPGESARAEELAREILVACVEAGGSLTGEHGIGTDKACAMPLMFGEVDLATMQRLRTAFDPRGLANPGKIFPTPRLCGEVPGPYREHPLERAGLGERF